MARQCVICGKRTVFGRSYAKRGLSRRKKGAGIKITGISARSFSPNLLQKRIVLDGKVINAKICLSCLKKGQVVLAK